MCHSRSCSEEGKHAEAVVARWYHFTLRRGSKAVEILGHRASSGMRQPADVDLSLSLALCCTSSARTGLA